MQMQLSQHAAARGGLDRVCSSMVTNLRLGPLLQIICSTRTGLSLVTIHGKANSFSADRMVMLVSGCA